MQAQTETEGFLQVRLQWYLTLLHQNLFSLITLLLLLLSVKRTWLLSIEITIKKKKFFFNTTISEID